MFRTILLSAGIAGVLAALALTLLQTAWITPLILQAETYESAEPSTESAHDHSAHEHAAADHEATHEHGHHHDGEWKPHDGLQRTFFTFISNTVMGVAYALMLAGVYTLWRQPSSAAQGLLFGLAGFAVFFAAPSLGLPPELPGTEAADLGQRQAWWVSTAASTAVGLTLLIAQKNWLWRAVGLIVLLIPHIVGAPHPAVPASLAPAELQNHFRVATVVGNALFWLLLGAVSAIAWRKFSEPQASEPQAEAA